MNATEAQAFFEKTTGEKCLQFYALPQSGSSRMNFIAETPDRKRVVTYNENLRENEAFFYFSEIFESLQLNTPHLDFIDHNRRLYIQEHLGDHTLSEIISNEGPSDRVNNLVKKSLEQLYALQHKTLGKIDYSQTFEYHEYDEMPIMHDLYYFKNFMADVLELPYHKSSLLQEFKNIALHIENLGPKTLMIRDFQSRNILVKDEEVFFIDYQSAMQGPALYDVVSFLFQAKANFPEDFKKEMLSFYASFFPDREQQMLKDSLPYLKLVRFLQVLGAYGFRGLIQKKSHFLESIDLGIQNVKTLLETEPEMKQYTELSLLVQKLSSEEASAKMSQLLQP